MQYWLRILVALTCAAVWGQNVQMRGVWSIGEPMASASAIFVGDVVGGTGREEGSAVFVKARVKVVRVLSGELAPDSEVAISWRFMLPPDSLEPVDKVPPVRALWMVRTNGERLEAMRTEAIPTRMGGFFTVVPQKPLPPELQYAPDAPIRVKVANELGWRMAVLATGQPSGGAQLAAAPAWLIAQDEVLSLHQTLGSLDAGATRAVYQYFSASAEPSLELFGIAGRATKNDITAVFDLERDYNKLASADEGNILPRALMSLNFVANREASHALGRVALSQNAIAAVDSVFAFRIWMTGDREFLPYLMAMLGSPDPTARGAALFGVCQIVKRNPENDPYCFQTFRVKDDEQDKEKEAVKYWRTWWEQNRMEIAKTTRLPDVVTPARYGGKPQEADGNLLSNIPESVMARLNAADRDAYREVTKVDLRPGPLQEQLRQKLSSEGWSVLEQYLKERSQDPPLMRFQK